MYIIKFKTLILYTCILCIFIGMLAFLSIDRAAADETELAENQRAVPIIMYHSITTPQKKTSKYVISSQQFEEDLKYIKAEGYTTITMQQLIDFVHDEADLPEKPILLSFDDGYYNNYCYAYPLLQKYQMSAVISIIGKYTDLYSENEEYNPNYSHITWDNIREMEASGLVEIQNHSYNMHTNTEGRNGTKKKKGESREVYRSTLEGDLMKLQERLAKETGKVATTFTYPFGGVSSESYEIIKNMGFEASLSCEEKMNYITKGDTEGLYMLNRYLRTNKRSVSDILRKQK